MSRLGLGRLPMILMYHSVADVPDDPSHLHVASSRFAEQMAALQRLGLRGVSMRSLVDAMRAGRERRLVGITFDDGYLNILEAALPELKRRGFTATAFVIAGRLGGTNEWAKGPSFPLLSDSQVCELADAGMEIGSHSMTHVRMAAWPPASSKPRSARAAKFSASSWALRWAASPTRMAPWTRPLGARLRMRATTTHAPWRLLWPNSGSWRCPGSMSASGTGPPG